ncbi:membrane-bound alpha-1,6- mannosyltransferase Initiation-specific [Agyrium rufum]|nr:membrane-bound alpha-1,6- mannosyltransferase Initiation-specific [Agyrium rufum]
MLTFRKALAIAAVFFTVIYLLQTSTQSKSSYAPDKINNAETSSDGGISHPKSTGLAQLSKDQISRPYPPPRGFAEQSKTQVRMNNMEGKTLRERLRFQFPYDTEGKFPAYIWQTWKYTPAQGEFSDDFRVSEASWTEMHPSFVHEVITDRTAAYLIRYLYASVPEVVEAYNALPIPVLKADFFRYLILLARGGIYSDIDTTVLRSAIDWIPADIPPSSIGLIVGIEADPDRPDWQDWYSRRIQFCQWTIQAKAGHPVLRNVVATITEDTLRMKKLGLLAKSKLDKSVVEFTGPAVWTDTIFNYLNSPEYFKIDSPRKNITWEAFTGIESSKKIGDVVVLPITSFSPGVNNMGAKDIDDPMAFVKHEFEGTWKPDEERIKPVIST